MRIVDWSADVCSSDLVLDRAGDGQGRGFLGHGLRDYVGGISWGSALVGNEVDQLLDRSHQLRLEVGVGLDPSEELAPERARRGGDPEGGEHAFLPDRKRVV